MLGDGEIQMRSVNSLDANINININQIQINIYSTAQSII